MQLVAVVVVVVVVVEDAMINDHTLKLLIVAIIYYLSLHLQNMTQEYFHIPMIKEEYDYKNPEHRVYSLQSYIK